MWSSVVELKSVFQGADCTDGVVSVTHIQYHATTLLISLRFAEVKSDVYIISMSGVKGDILDAK